MPWDELLQIIGLSALPVSELRGAIPLAVFSYGWSLPSAFLVAVLGNLIPVFSLPFVLERIIEFLGSRSQRLRLPLKLWSWFLKRMELRHAQKFKRFRDLGLVILVAIPAPFTGAWTGILAAVVFRVPRWRAIRLITLGVFIAGFIVSGLTALGQRLFVGPQALGLDFSPAFAAAKPLIVINEVAWMGTSESPTNEWLELYYPPVVGTSSQSIIDLNGWQLEWDNGKRKIELQGQIRPGDFLILERTADDTLPDITADVIYRGSLGNGGEHLKLMDKEGNVVDDLDFEAGWPAGDNDSKQTMERVSALLAGSDPANWQTSAQPGGTPGAENSKGEIPAEQAPAPTETPGSDEQEPDETVPEPASAQPQGSTSAQPPLEVDILLKKGEVAQPIDRLSVFSGQVFELQAAFKGKPEELIWNFGNGQVQQTQALLNNFVQASYQFPGKYILTLTAKLNDQQAQDQLEVVVWPRGIVVSEFLPNPVGPDQAEEWIELANQSSQTIDLGGLILDDEEGGSRPFTIPPGTFIFPHKFLVFPRSITGLALNNDADQVRLLTEDQELISAVRYQAVKEGEVVALDPSGQYKISSKPTPGFANVVNPDASLLATLPSLAQEPHQQSQRGLAGFSAISQTIEESPLKKLSLLQAQLASIKRVSSDDAQTLGKREGEVGELDLVSRQQAKLTEFDRKGRSLVLALAVFLSLGLVVLGGLLRRKPADDRI